MKNNNILECKLRNYSILAGLVLTSGITANGQIVYHNIPDTTLYGVGAGQNYSFDLNGDGINDLLFYQVSGGDGFHLLNKSVSFDGEIDYTTDTGPFYFGLPFVVNSGNKIGASRRWASYQGLKQGNKEAPADLAGMYLEEVQWFWGPGETDKFLGLRIKSDSGFNYGWLRLTVARGGSSITFLDYAYQTTLNKPIIAGDTSTAQTKELTIQSSNEKCATVETSARNHAFGDRGFEAASIPGRDSTFTIVRSFLQFDLSFIPERAVVNWAKLSLFSLGENFGPNTSILRRITSEWNPAKVTWNTQPATAKRSTVRLPASTFGNEDYKNIDVGHLVQAMVKSPDSSFGFALRLDTERETAASLLFWSPSYDKPHETPKLVINYTTPGMPPSLSTMSIPLNGASTEMTIYPNPCDKAFYCNIKSASTQMTLKVIDLLGRTVYSQPVNSSNLQLQVNLPSSSAGTYFVVLQDNKNATIVSQQLQVN